MSKMENGEDVCRHERRAGRLRGQLGDSVDNGPLCTGTVKLYGFRMHVGCYRYEVQPCR